MVEPSRARRRDPRLVEPSRARRPELTHVEREIGSHHIFYPERGRPVHRARERRARAPVDLGDPVDTLPRFPDREESFDLVHAGSATPNLRGSYLLTPDGWRRVASCP